MDSIRIEINGAIDEQVVRDVLIPQIQAAVNENKRLLMPIPRKNLALRKIRIQPFFGNRNHAQKIINTLRGAWQTLDKFCRYAAWHRRRGCSLCGSAKRAAFWIRNELKQQRA